MILIIFFFILATIIIVSVNVIDLYFLVKYIIIIVKEH